jgi:hypothetical protein
MTINVHFFCKDQKDEKMGYCNNGEGILNEQEASWQMGMGMGMVAI